MSRRILFVCLGNICRSPTAEAVLRARAAARGLVLEVDSAGTGDWHVGQSPYAPMIEAAAARGYDLSPLRARQVVPQDFARFDLILAMDAGNHTDLVALAGGPDTVRTCTRRAGAAAGPASAPAGHRGALTPAAAPAPGAATGAGGIAPVAMPLGDPAELCLLSEFDPLAVASHIPDPYYTRDFTGVLDLIERCIGGLLDHLATRPPRP